MAATRIIVARQVGTVVDDWTGETESAALAVDYELMSITEATAPSGNLTKYTHTYTYKMSLLCLSNVYSGYNVTYSTNWLTTTVPNSTFSNVETYSPQPTYYPGEYDIYHYYGYIQKDITVTFQKISYGTPAKTNMTVYWGCKNAEGSKQPFSRKNGSFTLEVSPNGAYKANIGAASTFYAGGNPWISYTVPSTGLSLITSLQVGVFLEETDEQMLPWHDVPIVASQTYTIPLTDEERLAIQQFSANFANAQIVYRLKSTIDGIDFYSNLERSFIIVSSGTKINPTYKDTSPETTSLTKDNQRVIRYFSDIEYTMGLEPDQEATIKEVTAVNGAQVLHTEEGTFKDVEKADIVFTCTDSRDIVTTKTVTMQMVDYKKLTCNLKVDPPTGEGKTTIAVFGNLYYGVFDALGTNENTNGFYVMYRFKERSGDWSGWTTLTHELKKDNQGTNTDGNDYYASIDISGLDYLKSYVFQARAVDMLMTVNTPEKIIATVPVFDWSGDDFNFNVPVTYTEGVTNVYNLSGAAKALSVAYPLETTYTPGTNYSAASGSNAVLLGGNLRCYIYVTRKTATGAGNVANEVVASVKIKHSGKIKAAYRIGFCNGGTGGVALFQTTNEDNDGTYLTFDIQLLSTGGASTEFSTFFNIPCVLNLDAY